MTELSKAGRVMFALLAGSLAIALFPAFYYYRDKASFEELCATDVSREHARMKSDEVVFFEGGGGWGLGGVAASYATSTGHRVQARDHDGVKEYVLLDIEECPVPDPQFLKLGSRCFGVTRVDTPSTTVARIKTQTKTLSWLSSYTKSELALYVDDVLVDRRVRHYMGPNFMRGIGKVFKPLYCGEAGSEFVWIEHMVREIR